MYMLSKAEKVVRIPPSMLHEDIDKVTDKITCDSFEGKVEHDYLTVLISNVKPVGLGRIVHGDGAVYQEVTYEQLVFRPQLQEIVEGTICEVLKFGAFVRFGPLDGLLHISQIMDDRINIDADNQRLVGKDNSRTLSVGDKVRARIVALSLNERNPRESKIGLTMRQPGLGKLEWLEEDRKNKEAAE